MQDLRESRARPSHPPASSPVLGTLVDTVDRERAAFIKEYFHVEWPNRSIYHAMFNTDTGDEAVIQAILNFLQQSQSTGLAAD